jgi:hypothetical protein
VASSRKWETLLLGRKVAIIYYLAREKVGQSFRDSLSGLYKSSNNTKHKRRVAVTAGLTADIEQMVQSNKHVASRIGKLFSDLELLQVKDASEFFVSQMFTQANLDILETFKKDESLLVRFHEAEASQKLEALAF